MEKLSESDDMVISDADVHNEQDKSEEKELSQKQQT